MKIRNGIAFILAMAAAIGTQAANYLFTAQNSYDVFDESNWVVVTDPSFSIWTLPHSYAEGAYSPATAPVAGNTIGFVRYSLGDSAAIDGPGQMLISSSLQVAGFIDRSNRSSTIYLGGAGKENEDMNFEISGNLEIGYSNTQSFVVSADASQKTFNMSIGDLLYLANGTYNFGSKDRYLDTFTLKRGQLLFDSVFVNTYAKQMVVQADFNLDQHNATSSLNKWTIYAPDTINSETAFVTIGGKLSKADEQLIYIDFSNVELLENTEYAIISAASTSGFDFDNPEGDFEISGLDMDFDLAWTDNTLYLTTVPEPQLASFAAAIFGAIAAAFARRKFR